MMNKLWAKGIQGRQTAGLGGPQKSGAGVCADENGLPGLELKRCGQDNGICSGQMESKDELIGLCDDLPRHIHQPNPARSAVAIDSPQAETYVSHRVVTLPVQAFKHAGYFAQGKSADDQEIFRVFEDSVDDFGACFPVKSLHQRARVEHVEHDGLLGLPQAGDGLCQTAFELGQSALNFRQGRDSLRQKSKRNVFAPRRDRKPGSLQGFYRQTRCFRPCHDGLLSLTEYITSWRLLWTLP